MKPVIGLTTYGHDERITPSEMYDLHYSIPKEYVDSVVRAGGIPLLIPAYQNDWPALWEALDGIVVTGGIDVTPSLYDGDDNTPEVYAIDPERDATEIALIRHAMATKDLPVLCICRGLQILNVALGGTLHPHIPAIRDQDIHRNEKGLWTLHDCLVQPDSQLAKIMGTQHVKTFSGHHQAVDRVAEGLQVVATASDGIIEGLIAVDHPWLVGVQWHPEKSSAEDPTQQRLFDALVEYARTRSKS